MGKVAVAIDLTESGRRELEEFAGRRRTAQGCLLVGAALMRWSEPHYVRTSERTAGAKPSAEVSELDESLQRAAPSGFGTYRLS